ncbi:MAG: hypothetical protein Q7J15_02910 [Candidatus Desulfaltia sp.]|nr:hypothetical protein [Candidatus Desulfaltia sp.]
MEKYNNFDLKSKQHFGDCVYWAMMALIPFIIACVSVAKSSFLLLGVYLVAFVTLQILIFRFLCTHCPHYCEDSKRLPCLSLWNFKKIFKPRPGPWSLTDKMMLLVLMSIICAFPIYWIFQDKLLLIIYILSVINFVVTLKKYECSRCIYFHCPNNSVPEENRKRFLNKENIEPR